MLAVAQRGGGVGGGLDDPGVDRVDARVRHEQPLEQRPRLRARAERVLAPVVHEVAHGAVAHLVDHALGIEAAAARHVLALAQRPFHRTADRAEARRRSLGSARRGAAAGGAVVPLPPIGTAALPRGARSEAPRRASREALAREALAREARVGGRRAEPRVPGGSTAGARAAIAERSVVARGRCRRRAVAQVGRHVGWH